MTATSVTLVTIMHTKPANDVTKCIDMFSILVSVDKSDLISDHVKLIRFYCSQKKKKTAYVEYIYVYIF